MRRTSSSRTIRNPALDRSRTCRTRRSYQPSRTRAQQPQTVFLSADQAARSAHPDHQTRRARSHPLETLRTNTHPTDAAAASPIWPCLSMPKSSRPPSQRRPLSTSTSAAMIPQNHPLDFLKTRFFFQVVRIPAHIPGLCATLATTLFAQRRIRPTLEASATFKSLFRILVVRQSLAQQQNFR